MIDSIIRHLNLSIFSSQISELNLAIQKTKSNYFFLGKMQVGYRSTLRASQSISDLSHTANLERTRAANRVPQQGKLTHFQPNLMPN